MAINGKVVCQTTIGASNTCSLGALRPNTYSLTVKASGLPCFQTWCLCPTQAIWAPYLQVLVAPDQMGTYEIRVEQANMAICFGDGTGCSSSKMNDPDEGTVDTYQLKVCKDATMADCTQSSSSE